MNAKRRRTAAPRKTRDADASRARVFAAAAEEFAAHGFDGAKVDRIAERAGMNKAMLYYHFAGKAALYRSIVGEMFGATAAAVRAARDPNAAPEAQLETFIATVAREAKSRKHFPPIWLRELADGGRHLDDGNFADMVSVVSTLGEIIADGERRGEFRPVAPFLTQLGIVGPLLLFLATAPIRERATAKMKSPVIPATVDGLLEHVKLMTLGVLRRESRAEP